MTPPKFTLLPELRRAARALRHTPDRLLHGYRYRRSMRELMQERPLLTLFLCYGNICRSPYAAAAFRRLGDEAVRANSAGFIGAGRSVPECGQRVALRRGIDLSAHRSQLLTKELVDAADLIVVMAAEQRRALVRRYGREHGILVLGDLDPLRIDTRTVRDPFNQSEDVFTAVYDRIDRCLSTLIQSLDEASVA